MKHPTIRDIESKIRVILFTDEVDDFVKLRNEIYNWARYQGVNIYWVTCFADSVKRNQGVRIYFEDETDATAFKLAWI